MRYALPRPGESIADTLPKPSLWGVFDMPIPVGTVRDFATHRITDGWIATAFGPHRVTAASTKGDVWCGRYPYQRWFCSTPAEPLYATAEDAATAQAEFERRVEEGNRRIQEQNAAVKAAIANR